MIHFDRDQDLRDTLSVNIHKYKEVLENYTPPSKITIRDIKLDTEKLAWSSFDGDIEYGSPFELNFNTSKLVVKSSPVSHEVWWYYAIPITSPEILHTALQDWFRPDSDDDNWERT